MKFYILASLILFGLIIYRASKKQRKKQAADDRAFWERERLSNEVRRKPLDNLPFIKIPLENLPTNLMTSNVAVSECLTTLKALSAQPIVNLTGYSNTDLKLEYGTANLTLLSEYDQNYTLLVRTLQAWAELLYQNQYINETKQILEFAVSISTDVSRTYYLLAEIYASDLEYSKIEQMFESIQNLRSANKTIIARTLQESYL